MTLFNNLKEEDLDMVTGGSSQSIPAGSSSTTCPSGCEEGNPLTPHREKTSKCSNCGNNMKDVNIWFPTDQKVHKGCKCATCGFMFYYE